MLHPLPRTVVHPIAFHHTRKRKRVTIAALALSLLQFLLRRIRVIAVQVKKAVEVATALVQSLHVPVILFRVAVGLDPAPVHVEMPVAHPVLILFARGHAVLRALLHDVRFDGDGLVPRREPVGGVCERLCGPPRRLGERVDHRGHERRDHGRGVGLVRLVRQTRECERPPQQLDVPEVRVWLDGESGRELDAVPALKLGRVLRGDAALLRRHASLHLQILLVPLVLQDVFLIGRKLLANETSLAALDELGQRNFGQDGPVTRLENVRRRQHVKEDRPRHAILDVTDGLNTGEGSRGALRRPIARHRLLGLRVETALGAVAACLIRAQRQEAPQHGGSLGQQKGHARLLTAVGCENIGPLVEAEAALGRVAISSSLRDAAHDRVPAPWHAVPDAIFVDVAPVQDLARVGPV
mmetsp:Transcript_2243/g.6666  ORF Transcript_2243/g.6666 Transcript_2243/m.6666 type:complete len:411 (-) Transcript_2243:1273-2505(-)